MQNQEITTDEITLFIDGEQFPLKSIPELKAENEKLASSLEIIETQFHEQLEDELKPLQQEIEQLRQALEKAEMERDVFKRQLEELDTREKF